MSVVSCLIGVVLLAGVLPALLGRASAPPAGPDALRAPTVLATPLASAGSAFAPTPTTTLRPSPTPSLPAVSFPNGPLSASRGQRVTLLAQATPNAECSIDIGYQGAPDLEPATADRSGTVSWTWRVTGRAPTGSWPVTVSCGGRSGSTTVAVSS